MSDTETFREFVVFDTSPLSAFAKAQRMPTLREFCTTRRPVVTRAVLEELHRGATRELDLSWLEVVPVDRLDELLCLVVYAQTLGSGVRDMGEATVLAWAEVNGGIAIIDDEAAKKIGKKRRVRCHGTLWLILESHKQGMLSRAETSQLVDQLRDSNARFPCDGDGLFEWARQHDVPH